MTRETRLPALSGVCASALLLSVSVCGAAPRKSAPDPAATAKARQEIQAAYDRQAKGLAAKSLDGFFSGTAPDAVTTSPDGSKTTQAEDRKIFASILPLLKHGDAAATIQNVALAGDTAVVTVRQHLHMVLASPGQPATDMASDNTARDLWVRTAGGWKMEQSRNLTVLVKQNGKVIEKQGAVGER